MSAIRPEEILAELARAVVEGQPVVLATIVDTEGSVPRHTGTKMVVRADGSIIGTIGGGRAEDVVRQDAMSLLDAGAAEVRTYELRDPGKGDPGICGGAMTIFLEPYMTPNTVYVIGAGHVGKAVVDLAHWLGYRTIVIDDREGLVTDDTLPNADVRFIGSVEDALDAHPVSGTSSIVVVTRSVELDTEMIPTLLATPARYIGVMGSSRRWEMTREQLGDEGLADDALDRIHNPIGFDIGAESVEEIAVSIMSEVIASHTNATG